MNDLSFAGTSSTHRQKRWQEEAAFFDEAALAVGETGLVIDPLALKRYIGPRLRRRFSKEFCFQVMGDLTDRTVLDVGCGDGLNAVQFAMMGAKVTGVDISPKAIEVAWLRAKINSVSERITFVCSPIETLDLRKDAFDVVWGEAFLHHVIEELDLVMSRLAFCVKASGLLVFSEPVNLFDPLQRLRLLFPIPINKTPGERPLARAEIALVQSHMRGVRIRYYNLFGRLDRFILINHNYERSSAFRRIIVNGIDFLDYALLSLRLLRNLAGACVIYGRPRKE